MIHEKAFYRHKDLPEIIIEVIEVSKEYVIGRELIISFPRVYDRGYFERFYELDG